MSKDDSELVERCRKGDHQAFRALVDRHGRRAFGLALRLMGNPADAEEALQDAFVKAYKSIERFRGGSSFYTWFFRIVHNVCIDHLRKLKRRHLLDYDDAQAREQEVEGADELLPFSLDADPVKVQGRRELKEQMEQALAELSPLHQEVIVLREVEGLSYEEIAGVIGCPKGTVMSRLHHARRQMTRLLQPYVERGVGVGEVEEDDGAVGGTG